MDICDFCGLGARLPSLVVCGSCFGVRMAACYEAMRDPAAAEPDCHLCGRQEGDPGLGPAATAVDLLVVGGEDRWTCDACARMETPEGWEHFL